MREFFRMVFASMLGMVLIFFVGFLFFVGTLVGAVGFQSQAWDEGLSKGGQNDILRVTLSGPLSERSQQIDVVQSLMNYNEPAGMGLFELTQTLQAAAEDDDIRGLFLNFKGVTAGWAHLESLRREVVRFKEAGKFVVAYAENYSEKTYFLASAADEVILYPRGFFEWDGMFASGTYFKRAMDKWDVAPQIFRVGKYKSAIEPFITDKMSEASREQLNALVGGIWGKLSQTVAERSKIPAEALEKWASEVSSIFASEAFEKKFIDVLATFEEVEERLKKLTKAEDEPGYYDWGLYYAENVKQESSPVGDQIAVIFAEGSIVGGRGEPGQVGSDEISRLLRKVADDDEVRAVVLRVNSPGGSALASDVMWASTQYVKEKKPIVASFGNVAASGGYYMSAGSHWIMAESTSVTGSIGVFGLNFNTEKFFNNHVGITFDSEKTHPMADMQSTTRELTVEERHKMQSVVDRIYSDFLAVVTEGRPALETVQQSHTVAQGRVWLASDAQAQGLVDEFGGLSEAIAKAAELAEVSDYNVVDYPRARSPFEEVLRQFGQASASVAKAFLPDALVEAYASLRGPRRLSDSILTRMPFDIEFH